VAGAGARDERDRAIIARGTGLAVAGVDASNQVTPTVYAPVGIARRRVQVCEPSVHEGSSKQSSGTWTV